MQRITDVQTYASRADKYALYEQAVQSPHFEVEMLGALYEETFGRPARVLREDFCGTAAVARAWVESHPERLAAGVDIDPEPLGWAYGHNIAALTDAQQARIQLLQEDVCTTGNTPEADVVAAQNYSFWVFKTRAELLRYFRVAHANLAPQGVLVLDMMGGTRVATAGHTWSREVEGFTYTWSNAGLDAITHDGTFHISFNFFDGSSLPRAFEYRWRLWTLPEVREALLESGFAEVRVYFGVSEPGGQTSYQRRQHMQNSERWTAYVVAIKRASA